MEMEADLLAIGVFNKAIVDYLDYPKQYYDDMIEGAAVITTIFHCSTTSRSHELAELLDIHNVYDFNKHFLSNNKMQKILLNSSDSFMCLFSLDETNKLDILTKYNFWFIFRPNR